MEIKQTKTVMARRSAGHPAETHSVLKDETQASPGWPAFAGHDNQNLDDKSNKIASIARRWIGTPYIHQASVKGAGCDCLGLLRGVWRELHGEDAETPPPYSPDWAEATGEETLYNAMKRHLTEIDPHTIAPGDIALFRMLPRAPAKHCGIVARNKSGLTLIHARQNKRVSEEPLSILWRRSLVFAFQV